MVGSDPEILLSPETGKLFTLVQNQERWDITTQICEDISIFTLNVVIDILNRCVHKEIQNHLDKHYAMN